MANRAYRISFDHKVSKFVIEVQGFAGLSWSPARRDGKKVAHFDSYKEARDYVAGIGLDSIYADFTKGAPWAAKATVATVPPKNEVWSVTNYPSINTLIKEQAA